MPNGDTDTVPFSAEHAESDFRSGVAPLDNFFKTQAGQNQRKNVSRTWVLERSDEAGGLPLVLGFYTITLGAVESATLPAAIGKKLPRYPAPVVIIGRLASDERARGIGVGERLLLDAHVRAIHVSETAGGVGIIVDAKDERAQSFYRRYGYEVLEQSEAGAWPKRMFLPMQTVRSALED